MFVQCGERRSMTAVFAQRNHVVVYSRVLVVLPVHPAFLERLDLFCRDSSGECLCDKVLWHTVV